VDPGDQQNSRRDEGSTEEIPAAEDFLPTPRRRPRGFEVMPGADSLWGGAILIFLMTAASLLSWSMSAWSDVFVITRAQVLGDHQYWRLFTAILGHGDIPHLAHNLPVYLFFAWILQGYFGWMASLLLPLLIGILSNGLTVYFYDDHIRLLGASGMIYGMVSLWLSLYVRYDRGVWWVKRVMRSAGFSLLVLFPQTYDPKISYLAHLTGFLCGLVLGVAFGGLIGRGSPVLRDLARQEVDNDLA
jgi:membrane associated rhomboid family serine protease